MIVSMVASTSTTDNHGTTMESNICASTGVAKSRPKTMAKSKTNRVRSIIDSLFVYYYFLVLNGSC
jgi:hypothetical protein